MKRKAPLLLIFLLVFVPVLCYCGQAKEELIIFHAGSLSSPMRDLAAAFEKENPYIKVRTESAGSRETSRKVSELKRKADIVAVADYQVIEDILIPEYAYWYIKFSRNKMVIAFTEKSKYGNEINSENWYEILSRKDVRFGRSDPDLDPCGYRTLMVWQLADRYYKQIDKAISIYEMLNKNCPANNIRPSEIELLSLIESVALDYAFEYLSIALQHNLKYINLSDEINLGNPELDDLYRQAKVMLTGKTPGEWTTVYGTAIIYALTIPEAAPNYKTAVKFIEFILSENGRRIMEKNGQPLIEPAIASDMSKIPLELKRYCH